MSEFLSDGRQCVCLDGKVIELVDVVSRVPQGSVLEPLLFRLYTSELFHRVGNYIVGYADDTTIYAVIPRQLSRPRVMESLNKDLAIITSWCLQYHMRLNLKKMKPTMVSRSRTISPGYDDLTLGGAELEEVKSLRVLEVLLGSKLTFEVYLRERQPGSPAAGSQRVVR